MSFENFHHFGSGAMGVASAASSIIGGIGSALQARKNRKFAREMQQRQFDWQRKENELAYERNLEMWNKQNAYNSPAAQMERLKQAGLNPNLAYGNLANDSASNAPQAIPTDVPALSESAFNNPYESVSNMGNSLAQNSLSMAQTAKTLGEKRVVNEQYVNLKIQNGLLEPTMKANLRKLLADCKLSEKEYDKKNAEIDLINQNLKNAEEQFKILQANKRDMDLKFDSDELDYFAKVQTQDARIKGMLAREYISTTQARYLEKELLMQLRFKDLSCRQIQVAIFESEQFFNILKQDKKFQKIFDACIKNEAIARANASTLNAFISAATAKASQEIADRVTSWYTQWYGDVTFFLEQTGINANTLVQKLTLPGKDK